MLDLDDENEVHFIIDSIKDPAVTHTQTTISFLGFQ